MSNLMNVYGVLFCHRYHVEWLNDIEKHTTVALHQVDSHNIVPVWVTSDKQEYAARTIRSVNIFF